MKTRKSIPGLLGESWIMMLAMVGLTAYAIIATTHINGLEEEADKLNHRLEVLELNVGIMADPQYHSHAAQIEQLQKDVGHLLLNAEIKK